MSGELGVGVVGVNAGGGWARDSHVPAVQGLRGLRLAAVATRSQESAEAAAAAFGAGRAYGDPSALIADPEVGVVAVVAPVPAHRDLVLAAVRAGKHVLIEWPLGVDTRQNAEIVSETGDPGVHVAVGLQARLNPAVARLRRLLAEEAIGRVLNVTVFSSTMAFGPKVPPAAVYLEDPAVGMHLATILLGHTLDLTTYLLGTLTGAAAEFTTRYPGLVVEGTGERLTRVLPDHVLVQGRVRDGVPISVQVTGGRPPADTPFRMEIEGEDGTLVLAGGSPRGFQAGLLRLEQDGERVAVDDGELGSLPAPAVNVAGVYAALRDDVHRGTTTAPTVDDALRLARLIDSIRA
ncbi:Gfo/Idh/MocA family oxidoreductase, partial [Catenuloplanes japonicus]|uniref:Gfo/Idh/MocA family oxidoreductase n=1 Tax=Catenuloplanes japonicus TaxID=33876 RepID=UPI00052403EC